VEVLGTNTSMGATDRTDLRGVSVSQVDADGFPARSGKPSSDLPTFVGRSSGR